MFNTIIKTFINFVAIFVLFLLGFSFSFFMLVQNQVPFNTIGKSFAKSLVMMIGEFEYEGIFEYFDESCDSDSVGAECDYNNFNFYHQTMYVMFVLFAITVTIIISNMLVGLAVDDIKAVQETAVLKRQALKIKLALESIYKMPNRWRHKWLPTKDDRKSGSCEIALNRNSTNGFATRFQNWLDPESYISRQKVTTIKHR